MERMAMFTFDSTVDALKRKKRDFKVMSTSYTKMIKVDDGRTVMFSNSFKNNSPYLLTLINKVRKDAKKFIEGNKIEDKGLIDYSSLIDNPFRSDVICKIDLNGAYWNYALKRGIITEDTDEYCNDKHEDSPYKKLKNTRLKSLGSLATRKLIQVYKDGVEDKKERTIKVENTRDLYIDICRGIDNLMKQCAREVDGCVYYYWDCMFADKKFSKEVVEFFKTQGFDTTVGETQLDLVYLGKNAYLLSKKDDKMYLVKKEEKHLLYD